MKRIVYYLFITLISLLLLGGCLSDNASQSESTYISPDGSSWVEESYDCFKDSLDIVCFSRAFSEADGKLLTVESRDGKNYVSYDGKQVGSSHERIFSAGIAGGEIFYDVKDGDKR